MDADSSSMRSWGGYRYLREDLQTRCERMEIPDVTLTLNRNLVIIDQSPPHA